jgi:hypothetical protein
VREVKENRAEGVEVEREMVFYREGGTVRGRMDLWKSVEGGLEADLRRLEAYFKAIGLEPPPRLKRLQERLKQQPPEMRKLPLSRGALEALMRFTPVDKVVRKWLAKTAKKNKPYSGRTRRRPITGLPFVPTRTFASFYPA